MADIPPTMGDEEWKKLPGETLEEWHERLQRREAAKTAHQVKEPTMPERAGYISLPDRDPRKPKAQRIVDECLASGEPFFVFRAKDILSIMVISHYYKLVEDFTPGNIDLQQGISQWLEIFRLWQREHMDKVRYPD